MPAPHPVDLDALRPAAAALAQVALEQVQDPERGVRVEDYITTLAAAVGESVIVDAGLFDIEHNDLTPGSAVFGDALNHLLSGDVADVASSPADTVIGILMTNRPDGLPVSAFDQLERVYAHVAASVNAAEWGHVALSIPAEHHPFVMPLRAAFELRPAATHFAGELGLDPGGRHLLCALALSVALTQVQGAIDPTAVVTLALEVAFTMAKTVPMPASALQE